MSSTPREVVYINGGELYKSPTDLGLGDNYTPDPAADRIFPFVKKDGKRYLFTTEFKSFFDGKPGTGLNGIDLCPDVNLWICLGAVSEDERKNFDVFFAIDTDEQLHKVAAYYGLPYPVTTDIAQQIEFAPETLCFWNAGGKPIVPAGVKFVDGIPTLFKVYTYPKEFGSWSVWMYGASYHDGGKCWEKGAVYQKQTGGSDLPGANMRSRNSFRKAEVIYTERADGRSFNYKFNTARDPVGMFWIGEEIDQNGVVIDTKWYESTESVRRMIGKMKGGADLSGFDLPPVVDFWLGKSYFENRDEVEIYFVVSGSAQLQAIADHYGLQNPLSSDQAKALDENPAQFRARHYDILGLGTDHFVPVVVGSVLLIDGVPSKLLMYTFMRQWEFVDSIVLPEFR